MSIERTIRGTKFQIEVDSEGMFWTRYVEQIFKAATLKDLEKKLTLATKKAQTKIKIPFMRFYWKPHRERVRFYGDQEPEGVRFASGALVGENLHTRSLRVLWEGKQKAEDMPRYYSVGENVDMGELKSHEFDELQELVGAYDEIVADLESFLEEHKVNLQEKWDAEVRKMEETEGEKEAT